MTVAPVPLATYGFAAPVSVTSAGVTFTATTTAAVGDTLVAVAVTSNSITMNTPSVPTGSGIVWSLRQSQTTASTGSFFIWTGTPTVGFSLQAITTSNVAGSAGARATFGVYRFDGSTGGVVGVSGKSAAGVTSVPSLSATLSADSAVVVVYTDFNAKSIPTYLTNAGPATITVATQMSVATLGVAYHADSGSAGSKNVGTSAPTSGISVNFGYLEILGGQSDAMGMVDSKTTTATNSRSATDPEGMTDSAIASFRRTPTTPPSDAFGMTDSVPVGRVNVSFDLGQFTDNVVVTQTINRSVTDAMGLRDGTPAQGSGTIQPPSGVLTPVLVRPALSDYQFLVDVSPYVKFGLSQTIAVSVFDPGTAEVRSQKVPGGASDVMMFGTDRKTPPLWTFQMVTTPDAGGTAAGALSWVDVLAQTWDNDVRLTPNGAQALRYGLAGRVRRVYGRPGRWTVNPDYVGQGVVHMTADFQLAETETFYDDVEQTLTLNTTPAVITGTYFQYPVIFPVAMATFPNARAGQLYLTGSQRSWVRVQFQGPVTNPWVQIGNQLLALTGNVPIGTTMTVSGRPWDFGIVSSTGAYHPEMLDPRFRLSQLRMSPGLYTCTYGGFDNTGSSRCVLSWHNAYRSI